MGKTYSNIQILHSSEGISKNYPHKVPLEQSNTPEAVAEGVWTVLKVPSVGNFSNALTAVFYLYITLRLSHMVRLIFI